jgi:HK97 family phage major capsid protein
MATATKTGNVLAQEYEAREADRYDTRMKSLESEILELKRLSRDDAPGGALGKGPASQMIRKAYQDHVHKSFPNPFGSVGAFFRAVRQCPGASADAAVRAHPVMKSYQEQYSNWRGAAISDYVQKSLGAEDLKTKSAPLGMNETVGADGAFLVPPQFVQQLLQRTYDNDLLSRTTLFPMTSNQLKIPAINETSRANGSRFGGIAGYWEGEAQTGTETKPGLAQIALDLSKLMILVRATDELLEDSGIALPTFIDTLASEEIAFKIGDGLINGDGAHKPLGILNAPCRKAVSRSAGASSANPIDTNLIQQMWAAMFLGCRKHAAWFINQELEPYLNQLTLGVGTGGVVTYLPPGGLSGAPYATLMGKPVLPLEFCSAPGTEGDIILADMSAMLSGTRGGMQSAVSIHTYFESAEQVFRFILRIDAKPWWLKPLTPYKGTVTKSCFVTASSTAS